MGTTTEKLARIKATKEVIKNALKTRGQTVSDSDSFYSYGSKVLNLAEAGSIKPTGTKDITSNGTHDVTSYASASVNVPIPTGYIKPAGTKNITSNGTHNVKEYENVLVNVESTGTGGITPSGTIEITANGDYDVSNYASAKVNVSEGKIKTLFSFINLAAMSGALNEKEFSGHLYPCSYNDWYAKAGADMALDTNDTNNLISALSPCSDTLSALDRGWQSETNGILVPVFHKFMIWSKTGAPSADGLTVGDIVATRTVNGETYSAYLCEATKGQMILW